MCPPSDTYKYLSFIVIEYIKLERLIQEYI